jgi:3-oxoacyl-[acyl-carrier protein] reductase
MDMNLTGKHALVCGASQGIGLASAIELAKLGADVTLLARREDVLKQLAAELPHINDFQQHDWIAVDGRDTLALHEKAQALVSAHPVHILFNNCVGPPPGSVRGASEQAFLDAYRAHLLANQALTEVVLPGMLRDGYGRIVNIISTSVKEPIAGIGVSNVTRGAVASWAKTLARELAPYGITVNNVLPGSTHTPRIEQIIAARAQKTGGSTDAITAAMVAEIPLGRFAEPSEIAAAVAFLASPAASYITGINVPVDGGRTRSL